MGLSSLGKETYWFHNEDYNKNFNYDNCLFITEGYGDNNIPLNPTSVYFVNFCINPQKYLEKKCRVIDIRFNVEEMHDCNYDFKIKKDAVNLSEETRYEKLSNNSGLHSSKRDNKITEMKYEAINFSKFKLECRRRKIKFRHINPWEKPVSFEDNIKLTRQSILSPDFRPTGTQQDIDEYGIKNGKNHLEIGYLPCRVLKTISYGRLGITDSKKIKEILGEHVEYDSDMRSLLNKCLIEKDNIERIKKAMIYVKEHHTYIQRVRDLMRCLIN